MSANLAGVPVYVSPYVKSGELLQMESALYGNWFSVERLKRGHWPLVSRYGVGEREVRRARRQRERA